MESYKSSAGSSGGGVGSGVLSADFREKVSLGPRLRAMPWNNPFRSSGQLSSKASDQPLHHDNPTVIGNGVSSRAYFSPQPSAASSLSSLRSEPVHNASSTSAALPASTGGGSTGVSNHLKTLTEILRNKPQPFSSSAPHQLLPPTSSPGRAGPFFTVRKLSFGGGRLPNFANSTYGTSATSDVPSSMGPPIGEDVLGHHYRKSNTLGEFPAFRHQQPNVRPTRARHSSDDLELSESTAVVQASHHHHHHQHHQQYHQLHQQLQQHQLRPVTLSTPHHQPQRPLTSQTISQTPTTMYGTSTAKQTSAERDSLKGDGDDSDVDDEDFTSPAVGNVPYDDDDADDDDDDLDEDGAPKLSDSLEEKRSSCPAPATVSHQLPLATPGRSFLQSSTPTSRIQQQLKGTSDSLEQESESPPLMPASMTLSGSPAPDSPRTIHPAPAPSPSKTLISDKERRKSSPMMSRKQTTENRQSPSGRVVAENTGALDDSDTNRWSRGRQGAVSIFDKTWDMYSPVSRRVRGPLGSYYAERHRKTASETIVPAVSPMHDSQHSEDRSQGSIERSIDFDMEPEAAKSLASGEEQLTAVPPVVPAPTDSPASPETSFIGRPFKKFGRRRQHSPKSPSGKQPHAIGPLSAAQHASAAAAAAAGAALPAAVAAAAKKQPGVQRSKSSGEMYADKVAAAAASGSQNSSSGPATGSNNSGSGSVGTSSNGLLTVSSKQGLINGNTEEAKVDSGALRATGAVTVAMTRSLDERTPRYSAPTDTLATGTAAGSMMTASSSSSSRSSRPPSDLYPTAVSTAIASSSAASSIGAVGSAARMSPASLNSGQTLQAACPTVSPSAVLPASGGSADDVSATLAATSAPPPPPQPVKQPNLEKRRMILQELISTEMEYVTALEILVNNYMRDSDLRDVLGDRTKELFYKVPEISMYHSVFYEFLKTQCCKSLDDAQIGALIASNFSKETVMECYQAFIENFRNAERVLDTFATKNSFCKAKEAIQRQKADSADVKHILRKKSDEEKKTYKKLLKQDLKALIIRPAQRLGRYGLLAETSHCRLRRLIENTPVTHADHEPLLKAESTVQRLVQTVDKAKQIEERLDTLKLLTLNILTDQELISAERMYIRHDLVQVTNTRLKDTFCLWLFSDLLIISSFKRKSDANAGRKSLRIKSPQGHDFIEHVRHKTHMRLGLEEFEVRMIQPPPRQKTPTELQLEEDLAKLLDISDAIDRLHCEHEALNNGAKQVSMHVRGLLAAEKARNPEPDANRMQLIATAAEGAVDIEIQFNTGERRNNWEQIFNATKEAYEQLAARKDPEFVQHVAVKRLRNGVQFCNAVAIDELNDQNLREVWICSTDGYDGHLSVLTLSPDVPCVTLNTPIPGHSVQRSQSPRTWCLCVVPVVNNYKRKQSIKTRRAKTLPGKVAALNLASSAEEPLDDSDNDSPESPFPRADSIGDDGSDRSGLGGTLGRYSTETDRLVPQLDVSRGTVWIGTDEGVVIVPSNEAMTRLTRNVAIIRTGSPVQCITYFDNRVFVALDNGSLQVYDRLANGGWTLQPTMSKPVGTDKRPISRMLVVAGHIWCAIHNQISMVDPTNVALKLSFHVSENAPICCMIASGLGVCISCQSEPLLHIYHSGSGQLLLSIDIRNACEQAMGFVDDVIRQHKLMRLQITCLLPCREVVFIGTSAGLVLYLRLPRIYSTTKRGDLEVPPIAALAHGHVGMVRFLCAADTPESIAPVESFASEGTASTSTVSSSQRSDRASSEGRNMPQSVTMNSLATQTLVISGGEGSEDYNNPDLSGTAGAEDSSNYLLIWKF